MDYNTQREHLILPEYGRNIQQMVNHILSLEDREKRNSLSASLIAIMGNMNPQLRDINDFKHKLWDHLHIMANFELDIDSPYPKPDRETIYEKPRRVPYPTRPMKHKHYGRSIVDIMEKTAEMEDGPKKEEVTQLIANHMKKSYLIWNKDSVTDEDILRDMRELSKNKLNLAPGFKLRDLKDSQQPSAHTKGKKKYPARKK